MVSYASLKERFDLINDLYGSHASDTSALQSECLNDLVPSLVIDELSLGPSGIERAVAFLEDPVTVFRFARKAHFDGRAAKELLCKTLRWRLTSSLDLISPSSVDPLYSENPLFFLHPTLKDKFGRHAAIINLAHVVRPEDGSLEGLKEYIAFQLEVTRRYLADLSKKDNQERDNPHIQIVVLLNLAGANFSNFEVELMPYVVDLLKNNFPGELSL